MKKFALADWIAPLVDLLKSLKNEFLIFSGAVLLVLTVLLLVAPQTLEKLWGLFVFFGVLAFLAFIIALFAPALSERLKTPASSAPAPSSVTPGTPATVTPTQVVTAPSAPLPDPETLRRAYLDDLVNRCAHLKMPMIDLKAATRQEVADLDLAAVFTDLDILDALPDERQSRKAALEPEAPAERRLPALAALSRYPRLVLLGDPGSGKSTLVDFITLCLAGDWLGSAEANLARLGESWTLPRMLPVRVILRDYAARGLPNNQGLWDFIQTELQGKGDSKLQICAAALKPYLREKDGALLLLDGLDEVPDAEHARARFKAAVESFAREFPQCRILVTARPYAYRDPEDPQAPRARLVNFEVRKLAQFSLEQIQAFIPRWYAHVGVKDPALGTDTAQKYAAQLQSAVETRPRLADLATNPLLLTLMTSLHRSREGGSLPDKRQELYEESVKLLLVFWQRPKQVFDLQGRSTGNEYDVFVELGIEPDALRRALNCVAYEAHKNQPKLLGTHDIRARDLAGVLYELADKRKAPDERRVIQYLTDRAGLLIEREQGTVYTFPHRTFQEYLAACYLAEEDFPYVLLERLREDDERWREATLLAAAKNSSGANMWNLLAAFCSTDAPPQPPTGADWYAVLRAGQALVETELYQRVPERQHYLITRLQTWLVALLQTPHNPLPAPERAAAGRTLAVLGDPRPGVGVRDASASALPLPDILWQSIPAGPFVMGSAKQGASLPHPETGAAIVVPADDLAYDDESPAHIQETGAYWIARYPITNAQFAAFEADPQGYTRRDWWTAAGWDWRKKRAAHDYSGGVFDLPNHPAVNVTWYEAVAFCNWLTDKIRQSANRQIGEKVSQREGEKARDCDLAAWLRGWPAELLELIRHTPYAIRLPTEAEWEKAARGGLELHNPTRRYPWGHTPELDVLTPEHANYDRTGLNATSAVGAFPLGGSVYGVLDLSGNVWEWCATAWVDNYTDYGIKEVKEKLHDLEGARRRVVRGGAFLNDERYVRCACRGHVDPGYLSRDRGFRVVLAAAPPLHAEL